MGHLEPNQMCSECGAMGDSMVYEDGYICYPKCWDKSRRDYFNKSENRQVYKPYRLGDYSGHVSIVDKGEK